MYVGSIRLMSVLVAAGLAGPIFAQAQGKGPVGGDVMARPTEYRIRFTPGMAQAIGNRLAKIFIRRYELDEADADEVAETVARRFMEAAHKLDDETSQVAIERMLMELLGVAADADSHGGFRGPPPRFGKVFAEGILPMLPTIRELIRDVGKDVRPKLAGKQQLKLVGDWAAVGVGLDGFEKMMQRWSQGHVDPSDNPFRPDAKKKDETGQTKALRQAKHWGEQASEMYHWNQWKTYVAQAKQYYRFDQAQSTTADSILQECIDRGERIIEDETWRRRMYWNRVWYSMSRQMRLGWQNPLQYRLDREHEKWTEPIEALGNELKERLDKLATEAQRTSAEGRLAAALAQQGYEPAP